MKMSTSGWGCAPVGLFCKRKDPRQARKGRLRPAFGKAHSSGEAMRDTNAKLSALELLLRMAIGSLNCINGRPESIPQLVDLLTAGGPFWVKPRNSPSVRNVRCSRVKQVFGLPPELAIKPPSRGMQTIPYRLYVLTRSGRSPPTATALCRTVISSRAGYPM